LGVAIRLHGALVMLFCFTRPMVAFATGLIPIRRLFLLLLLLLLLLLRPVEVRADVTVRSSGPSGPSARITNRGWSLVGG